MAGGWQLDRYAEKMRWALDDSWLAVWGGRRLDPVDDSMERIDMGQLFYGRIGDVLAGHSVAGTIDDVAWLPAGELAVLSEQYAHSNTTSTIEVIAMRDGAARARRDGPELRYATLASSTDGQLFLLASQFPARGQRVTILDPSDLHTHLELWRGPDAASGRTWIAREGAHYLALDGAELRLDGQQSVPLPHRGSTWVEWLTQTVFVVRDTKHPKCNVSVYRIDSTTPRVSVDPHADANVSIDIDAASTRVLVKVGADLTIFDLHTGAAQQLPVPPMQGPLVGARWATDSCDTIALLTRPTREVAAIALWNPSSGGVTHGPTVRLHGDLGEIASEITLERSPARQFLYVRWWTMAGQCLTAFPAATLAG
jgi:hypothetical protein